MEASHGASSSSSFLSSSNHRWAYHVFLSFRGEDTREAFTAHLYAALRQNDINTFMDKKLRSGEEISPALLKAIEESAISIIILSENYASSRWCLDELVKILECRKTRGQHVLPLFYHVDPSDVGHITNSVGKAFAKLEERFKHDEMKLQRWKTALSQVAKLSGKPLGNRNEPEFILEIIQWVNSILVENTYFQVAHNPKSRVQYVKPLLDTDENDRTCIVGIFETSGIDKTTIAKSFYKSIAFLIEENRISDGRNQSLCALDNNKKVIDLIDSENRISDGRNQSLRALDNNKKVIDLIDSENKRSGRRNRTLPALESNKLVKVVSRFSSFIKGKGKYFRDEDQAVFKEEKVEGINVTFFYLKCILVATNGFSDEWKVGEGGFGLVYKGTLPNGQEVAIKRLSIASHQGLKEFKSELMLIPKLQHMNIVRLHGYCVKGKEKILLYEFMRNGTLDSLIFDQNRGRCLDWKMRVNIILGIARGLLYLHSDSRWTIIHRDLKLSNILLDEKMNPKIADFGLGMIVEDKQTEASITVETLGNMFPEITTRIDGTFGYMAPEILMSGKVSVKSDVYSFGVVLLEIISGRKIYNFVSEVHMQLKQYAWQLWVENRVLDLMDQTLREVCNEDQFVKYVNIGLLCIQDDPNDRPTMLNVFTMLYSEAAKVPTPKQPAFASWTDTDRESIILDTNASYHESCEDSSGPTF